MKKDTSEVKVPEKLIDQIIGQDRAVKIIRNAAKQRRNILLIGTPGTGKSMLAQGMAELMPAEELEDVLMYPNRMDENNPLVRVVKTKAPPEVQKKMKEEKKEAKAPQGKEEETGYGRIIVEQERMRSRMDNRGGLSGPMVLFGLMIIVMIAVSFFSSKEGEQNWIIAAAVLGLFIFGASWLLSSQISRRSGAGADGNEPKLVVDNSGKKAAPFVDATGSKAGALFGDVKHDPLQSFMPDSKFYVIEGKKLNPVTFASLWKRMQMKYPERIEKNGEYEFVTFPQEEEVYVLSANADGIMPTRVMSMNRRMYDGVVRKISTGNGETVTTPEHKYVLRDRELEADRLSEGDELVSI